MSVSDLSEVPMCTTVDITDRDGVPILGKGLQYHSSCSRPRGDRQTILSLLEDSNGSFKILSVWVLGSGVLVGADWLGWGRLLESSR